MIELFFFFVGFVVAFTLGIFIFMNFYEKYDHKDHTIGLNGFGIHSIPNLLFKTTTSNV